MLGIGLLQARGVVRANLREIWLCAVPDGHCRQPPESDWEKSDVIRETMRRLHLEEAQKDEILMVGDRKFDVLGAMECGIGCVGVEFFGYAAPGELEDAGALAVARTAEELEHWILTH